MTVLIHFLRYEKSGFFFFLNKRNMSYPCVANVLRVYFVCLLGNPHWVELLLGLLLDQEMLSASGCAEWRHSNKSVNIFLCSFVSKIPPLPLS